MGALQSHNTTEPEALLPAVTWNRLCYGSFCYFSDNTDHCNLYIRHCWRVFFLFRDGQLRQLQPH